MATITVGPGEQYSTISAAAAAANSGDTINVDAGTYTNDFPTISQSLTLQAVGGTVHMNATQDPPNGKAIIDEGGSGVNVTINGFDLSGAQVPDGNGAGIRYEGGSLTLNNDNIHNNQEGLLSNVDPNGTITINGSTFTNNGAGDGYTHNIYAGDINSLTVQNSTIDAANVGHDIKSRAQNTTITNNTIEDGPSGNSSYEIDLPNGGNANIQGNDIEKGPNAQNPSAISFGEEGGVYGNSSLTVQNNTMLNDDPAGDTNGVVNDTGSTATVTGNSLYGWTTAAVGPANVSGNTMLTTEPALSSLTPGSAVISGSASDTAAPAPSPTPAPTPAPTPTPTPASTSASTPSDTLTLGLSEDAWQGDAQFVASLDGQQLGPAQSVTASHAAGQVQNVTFQGDFGVGPHDLAVTFLNDAYGGSPSMDRNLYVNSVNYDGTNVANGSALLYADGTVHFQIPALSGS